MKVKKVEFLTSAADSSSLPGSSLPIVAFAGRSNVGKSSLINALLNRKNVARTSAQPGKTRFINYFTINDKLHLVDLPGYGFARVSHKMQARWKRLVESFLSKNKSLRLVVVILDGRRGVSQMDAQLIEWLDHLQVDIQLVLTKSDKLSKNNALNVKREIKKDKYPEHEPILFSAVKRMGVSDLWGVITHVCSVEME